MMLVLTLSLSACGEAHFNKQALHSVAPEVPVFPRPLQSEAAEELQQKQCHALGVLLSSCLITRDQARLMY